MPSNVLLIVVNDGNCTSEQFEIRNVVMDGASFIMMPAPEEQKLAAALIGLGGTSVTIAFDGATRTGILSAEWNVDIGNIRVTVW